MRDRPCDGDFFSSSSPSSPRPASPRRIATRSGSCRRTPASSPRSNSFLNLYDSVAKLDIVRGALETAGVKDFYDSTNYRRFQQLLAYYEKALGKDRYELLDGLTGGGVVAAGRLDKPGAALLVVQAKDETLLKGFRQARDLSRRKSNT